MAKLNKSKPKEELHNDKSAGLFIPAGLLLGLGFGFIFGNIPAYMFLGLGAGFLFFALAKNKKN